MKSLLSVAPDIDELDHDVVGDHEGAAISCQDEEEVAIKLENLGDDGHWEEEEEQDKEPDP